MMCEVFNNGNCLKIIRRAEAFEFGNVIHDYDPCLNVTPTAIDSGFLGDMAIYHLDQDTKKAINHRPEDLFHTCVFGLDSLSEPCLSLKNGSSPMYEYYAGYCYSFNFNETTRTSNATYHVWIVM